MFLSLLNRKQKGIFLELELYMSKIDGDFSDEEKTIINTHCMEMHIDNNNYECELSLDEVISSIKNEFGYKEKRIVLLELMATVMADNIYHDSEKKLIKRLEELLGFTDSDSKEALAIINDIKAAYEKSVQFVTEE